MKMIVLRTYSVFEVSLEEYDNMVRDLQIKAMLDEMTLADMFLAQVLNDQSWRADELRRERDTRQTQ